MSDNLRDASDLQSRQKPAQPLDGLNRRQSRRQAAAISQSAEAPADDLTATLAELPGYDNLNSGELLEGEPMTDKQKQKALKKAARPINGKKAKKPKNKKKIALSILLVVLALIGIIYGLLQWLWPEQTLNGNWWDLFGHQRLKEDENGRSNILVFGTAPNDYDGPLLADTILVLSVNQNDKTAYMVSLPRDLWVQHDCPNPTLNTTAGRLNETYRCVANEDESNEVEASDEFRRKAGEITGLDIQYYVHLSWQGVEDAVNALGGVDITIESSDPRGIYDVNTGIKFANGEQVHMDGYTALQFARARGSDGGYGLEGSNFSRELHQQQIIKAIQTKTIDGGALSDPATVINLIQTLGNNVRTNFESGEVRTLSDLAKDTNADNIVSLPLLDADKGINLVTTTTINSASVVVPVAGTFDYSEIQEYIKINTSSDPVIRENALIDVLNGSETEGLAGRKAAELEAKNYRIGNIGNAMTTDYQATQIYQLSTDKPATAKALQELLGGTISSTLPYSYNTDADFVIIFGAE
jgi:LCP family protein required for cell wall assembly